MSIKLDPWGSQIITDYSKLFEEFGIEKFSEIIDKIPNPHLLMRRGVVFGHRDFHSILARITSNEKFAVMTGFMPSGRIHFGHKMVIDQLVWYQKKNAEIFIAIADAEAYAIRRLSREEVIRIGVEEYIASMLALGLENKRLHIYFQTNYHPAYYRLIQLFSRKTTLSEFKALYGSDISPGKIVSVLSQMADILHPQLDIFGGYKYVVVPVGSDQDPHIRFTRDIADRFRKELGLERPASTYHRFMTGLDGGKMSSSRPMSAIFLTDSPEKAKEKIWKALTGGRGSIEEQKKLGGEPEKCTVFEFFAYHLIKDDKELMDIYSRCKNGDLLCGDCKKMAMELLERWLKDFQKRREKNMELAYDITNVPEF